MNKCPCKDCRKMRKLGYTLGTVVARHFKNGWSPDGKTGPYSGYVIMVNKKKDK